MALNALNSIIEEFVNKILRENFKEEDLKTSAEFIELFALHFHYDECEEILIEKIIESDFWKNRTMEDLRSMAYYILKWETDIDEIIHDLEHELEYEEQGLSYMFIFSYINAYFYEMAYKIEPVFGPNEPNEQISFENCILNEFIKRIGDSNEEIINLYL